MSKDASLTSLSATPTVATVAPANQTALVGTGNPTVQYSTISGTNSSLSGAALSNFRTFTGSGMRTQAALTGGIFYRF